MYDPWMNFWYGLAGIVALFVLAKIIIWMVYTVKDWLGYGMVSGYRLPMPEPPPPPIRKEPRFPTCDWCGNAIKVDSRGQCRECGAPVTMRTYYIEPDPDLHNLIC